MGGPDDWDNEKESVHSGDKSPALLPTRRANKFDDEEGEDSDVLDSWDAAEDSEVEREKAAKAAEAKAKAEAEAKASKKSKAERIAKNKAEREARTIASQGESDETETQRRERLRRTEKESDMGHVQDLFGEIGIGNRKVPVAAAVIVDPRDPNATVNLGDLPLFNPTMRAQFEQLRETLVPLLSRNAKRPFYTSFLQEFSKQLAKGLPSDQVKKIASALTALSNEKMKEEKAAMGIGKKSKAAKTKTSLTGVSRGGSVAAEADLCDDPNDAFGDGDFM